MALTSLDIKDKTFASRMRGYDREEVDEFLDIVVSDYEDLVRDNHDKDLQIKNLEERLMYFDEMKESLSQSVIIAQDTAEKVKMAANAQSENIIHQAEQDAHRLLEEAKFRANEILRNAADNAKKVAIETEELKNKTRVFHQRLKSTIQSQLSIVDSSEWEEILRPTATYLETSDMAFREVVTEVLGEESVPAIEEVPADMTRQFSPDEMAELQRRIDEANRELLETQVHRNLANELETALEEHVPETPGFEPFNEPVSFEETPNVEPVQEPISFGESSPSAGTESVSIL